MKRDPRPEGSPLRDPRLADTRCPACGCKTDAATCISDEDAEPTPGMLSICFNCGAQCFFQDDLSLRLVTTQEREKFSRKLRLFLARAEVERRHAQQRKKAKEQGVPTYLQRRELN